MGHGQVRSVSAVSPDSHLKCPSAAAANTETAAPATAATPNKPPHSTMAADAPATTPLSGPYILTSKAGKLQDENADAIAEVYLATKSLPSVVGAPHKRDTDRCPGKLTETSESDQGYHHGGGNASLNSSYLDHINNARLLGPLALPYPGTSKASDADSAGARHGHGTTAVFTTQVNKRSQLNLCRAVSVVSAQGACSVPAGELECVASGFLSINDYIFVAESLKTLSMKLLRELGDSSSRGSGSGGTNAPQHRFVFDSHPDAATTLTLSWAAMRDALVARKCGIIHENTSESKSCGGGSTSISGVLRIAENYATMNGSDGAETAKSCHGDRQRRTKTQTDLIPVSEASLATGTAKGALVPTTPLASLPVDAVETTATLNRVSTGMEGVPDDEALRHCPLQPLAEANRVSAPPPRPLSMSDLTAIAEQDGVIDFYLQFLATRVRGIDSKLRVMSPSSVLRFFLASALSSDDASGMAALLPATTSRTVRVPGCADDKSGGDPTSSGTWISKKEIVLPAVKREEAQAAQAREDALAAMGSDLVKLFSDTKEITLQCMLIFAESMPLGINSRLSHDYLLPTAPIPENYVGCGLHARRRKDFFVSLTERVALLAGHKSFETPETLLLGISQLSNLASRMMSSFVLGAVLGCVSRWRELQKSGDTASDKVVEMMEEFATVYCVGYDLLMNEAIPSLRKQYPNLFFASSFTAKEVNSRGTPILTVVVSMLMKLLFLFAGGRESIRADDRRVMTDALQEEQQRRAEQRTFRASLSPSCVSSISDSGMAPVATAIPGLSKSAATIHATHNRAGSPSRSTTSLPAPLEMGVTGDFRLVCNEGKTGDTCALSDDVALSVALQVPSATLIVDMGALLMSGPLATHTSTEALVRTARAVSCIWRVLFQAVGFLPSGGACPVDMAMWLPLFPFYSLSTGAKHVMLSVYARAVGQTQLNFGPVLREDVLRSAVECIGDWAYAQDKKLSEAAHSSTVSEGSLHRSSLAIESSPESGRGDMSSLHTRNHGKLIEPVSAQHSYRLCPSFAAAPVHFCGETLHEGPFHASSAGPATLRMAKEQRKDFYELCARQSSEPFLPGVNITNQVCAFPLPGGVAMFRVEKLLDHSHTTVQRLKTYHDRLALIMSWQRPSLNHTPAVEMSATDDVAAATAMGQTRDACISAMAVDVPVHEGDELTIRWGSLRNDRAAEMTMRVQASFCNPRDFTNRQSPTVAHTRAVSRTAQKAPAPAALSTKELVDSDESHARMQGSHYPSLADAVRQKKHLHVLATAFSRAVSLSPPRPPKHCTGRLLEADGAAAPSAKPTEEYSPEVHVPAMQRSRVCLVLATANLSEFLVVLDTPNYIASTIAVSPRTPWVEGVLHHRRHCAPFAHEGAYGCAWTSPEFARSAVAGVPAPGGSPFSCMPAGLPGMTPSTALQVPVLLGWLLGQSAGNEEIFTLPLPPLAFRILGLAVQLELPVEKVPLTTADMSLLHPDLTNTKRRERLLQGLREPRPHQNIPREDQTAAAADSSSEGKHTAGHSIPDDLCISGSPAVAPHPHQRKKELIDNNLSIMWGIQGNGTAVGHAFWAAMLQGMRQTPLLGTPLFAQCSSRTVREVLCGSHDHLDEDFSFRKSFVLLVEDEAKGGGGSAAQALATERRGDRHFVHKSLLRVLDEFPLKEKRLLLRFITGHSLRTRRSQMDTLHLVVQSGFARAPPQCSKAKPPACTPSEWNWEQSGGVAMVSVGDVSAEVPLLTASSEAVVRACVDATLQLLPVAYPSEKTLVIPNYFEALLMGSYRQRVLGAHLPAFTDAGDIATTPESKSTVTKNWRAAAAVEGGRTASCAAVSSEGCVAVLALANRNIVTPFFGDADVQLAWAQLSVTQQETLCQRYRALLRHRVRAALYVYLLSNPDMIHEAWELQPWMGIAPRAVHSSEASTKAGELGRWARREDGDGGDGIAPAGGTFVRCDDGTVVFVECKTDGNEDGVAGDVDRFGSEVDHMNDLLVTDRKERIVDSAERSVLEERVGGAANTETPGNTKHARQQKRPFFTTDPFTASVGPLYSGVCDTTTKRESRDNYGIAAASGFPEGSERSAGGAQAAASSTTGTLHSRDAKKCVASHLVRDSTHASHLALPSPSGASAQSVKRTLSCDSIVVPMPWSKTAVQASTNRSLRNASMKATSTEDAAATAQGASGLCRELEDLLLRSEVDSYIQELFPDDQQRLQKGPGQQ
ncbi:hypothetical protein, unknown function [Leishmania tarentolae]|uniref:HECT domain-containing protein n=1 Tax=Leishmania tarentolae TaxID=5689 RepID=A0A640KGV3_LEITA|nr:hypothetical protein, unknown function [Leishmania tarentolae]